MEWEVRRRGGKLSETSRKIKNELALDNAFDTPDYHAAFPVSVRQERNDPFQDKVSSK